MSLQPGHKLAHYEILEPIGKGGMGEVYRAKDSKLGRDVAIKVLPDEFAENEERLARFKREAKVLASLNHPGIAAIYGFEESEGTHYLVLELVPGETLAERISRGPIPVEEALEIASKIAEALEEAHEQGIVHRDLKPANIKQTEDGKIKVLDFGLAKVFQEETPDADSSMSPTLTRDATRVGVILGTAAYMSPEQAKGKKVDKRTDIFAFGAVLYEMLTGKKAFPGEDVSEVLASVIKLEPDWNALPAGVLARLLELLHRCLEKDSKRRVRDIGDVRLALEGAFAISAPASEATTPKPRTRTWIAAIAVTGLVAGLGGWGLKQPVPLRVTRLTMSTPSSAAPRIGSLQRQLAISPTGEWLVYAGAGGVLHVRHIGSFETTRLNPVNASNPFVSRDGTWIGFEATNSLQKIPVLGGPATPICRVGQLRGASWGGDGTIVFADGSAGLFRVPARGGEPEQLTKPDGVSEAHFLPELLPGNEAVLFVIRRGSSNASGWDIAVLSLETGKHHVLIRGGTSPRYVPTGHIVYVATDALVVVPFDAERLEITGDAVTTISGIGPQFSGAANFDVSDNGVLIYQQGVPQGGNKSLVWVDRQGREEPLRVEPRPYRNVALSPDGELVVSSVSDATGSEDLWIHNLKRGSFARLTFDPGMDDFPVWTPDSERVLFRRSGRDGVGLFWKAADGIGSAERLTNVALRLFSVSHDGLRVVGVTDQALQVANVAEVSLDGDPSVRPLMVSPYGQWYPQISPSGRWLAYASTKSGRAEIYIRPYPDVDAGQWQVSTNGGTYPTWSLSEDELFYRKNNQIMTVPLGVTKDGGIQSGSPSVLFEGNYHNTGARQYDVAADGRFLMMKPEASGDESAPNDIHVVLNWFEEFKRLVNTDN